MSSEDKRAMETISRFESLRSTRMPYEADLQDIVDLVRPGAVDFNRQTSEGQSRWQYKYDGTAPQALEEFASGLCSFLVSAAERWFELEFIDHDTRWDYEAQAWLDAVTGLVYETYRYPMTGFQTMIHEAFLDIGSFGTCVVNQELRERPERHVRLTAVPLAQSYILEDDEQRVDTIFRRLEMTGRQIQQKFSRSADLVHPKIMEGGPEKKWAVLHAIYPRGDHSYGVKGPMPSTQMPIASCWIDLTHKVTLRESGFLMLPYHVARWIKFGDEPYGRSPAHTCLPEIRMVNTMERTNIKAGQKIVDPPLMVPDDGFLLPLETHPGALLFKMPGAENIEPLVTTTQLPVALENTEQKRDKIRQCFHTDWFRMGKENQEMTAFEVDDRRSEKLRFLAPMLGRLQSELLSPMISRTYDLLVEMGKIPPAPPTIQGKQLRITYVGTAAKAQLSVTANSIGRFIQDLVPLAQIKPEIFDVVDEDGIALELVKSRGVPMTALRSPQEIAAMRQQRQQQQALMTAAQAIEPASKAIKNIADARQTGM